MNLTPFNTIHAARRISVTITGRFDFGISAPKPDEAGEAYDLLIVKDGVLAREVGNGYNLFRPFNSAIYMTNVTSSERFSMEAASMTPDEFVANFQKLTLAERSAVMYSHAQRVAL